MLCVFQYSNFISQLFSVMFISSPGYLILILMIPIHRSFCCCKLTQILLETVRKQKMMHGLLEGSLPREHTQSLLVVPSS